MGSHLFWHDIDARTATKLLVATLGQQPGLLEGGASGEFRAPGGVCGTGKPQALCRCSQTTKVWSPPSSCTSFQITISNLSTPIQRVAPLGPTPDGMVSQNLHKAFAVSNDRESRTAADLDISVFFASSVLTTQTSCQLSATCLSCHNLFNNASAWPAASLDLNWMQPVSIYSWYLMSAFTNESNEEVRSTVTSEPQTLAGKLETLFRTVKSPKGRAYSNADVAKACSLWLQKKLPPTAGRQATMSTEYVRQLHKGLASNPTKIQMEALAAFFDVPASYFVDDSMSQKLQEELELAAMLRTHGVRTIALRATNLSPEQQRQLLRYIETVLDDDQAKS